MKMEKETGNGEDIVIRQILNHVITSKMIYVYGEQLATLLFT